jgi:hypothetical protein
MTSFVKVSTDSIQLSNDGFDFTADDETVAILANVYVGSSEGEGVLSVQRLDASILFNAGTIFGGYDAGVSMAGANASVTNLKGGVITGFIQGVAFQGSGTETFTNRGVVSAADTGVSFINEPPGVEDNIVFKNYGLITAGNAVLDNVRDASSGTLFNAGMINGRSIGLWIPPVNAVTTDVVNATGGTIEGRTASIRDDGGPIHLTNHGTIIGAIQIDNADDLITNDGRIAGVVDLGSGACHFDGRGGTSGAIFAEVGTHQIIAGNGNVVIHVGSGSNTLTGGPGIDSYIFESALAGQVDGIANFKPGVDKIVLSATDFAGIGPVGHALAAADFRIGAHPTTASQHILYDPATGFLSYDPDGTGAAPHVHFATFLPHLALAQADFLVVA